VCALSRECCTHYFFGNIVGLRASEIVSNSKPDRSGSGIMLTHFTTPPCFVYRYRSTSEQVPNAIMGVFFHPQPVAGGGEYFCKRYIMLLLLRYYYYIPTILIMKVFLYTYVL